MIVGRASDYVLKDYENTINIFIHAPFELRVNNIMKMYNDDEVEASENVKKSDYIRSSYYKILTGKKWNDLKNYTLSINSSVGISLCVEQICDLYNKMNK